jgi:hypothetical protein
VKPIVLFLVIVLLGPAAVRGAEAPTVAFYVQLLRGSDDDIPPAPEARLIGTELGRRLHGVFRWKNYWEIKRQCMTLSAGKTVRARLSSNREVEINLPQPQEMVVCIYVDGKLVRKRRQAVHTRFYITGGDNDGAQSWFIVVRRDKPGEGDTAQLRDMIWPAESPVVEGP